MKRDPQVFEWASKSGVLTITGRKDGPMAGTVRTYNTNRYPDAIRVNILDAGCKAIFQQRTSQVDGDIAKLQAWDDLDTMFAEGTWELEGGPRGAPIVGAWVEVLAKVKKVDVGAIQSTLADMDKAARDAVRANVENKYAKEIEAHKSSRKAQAVDLTTI